MMRNEKRKREDPSLARRAKVGSQRAIFRELQHRSAVQRPCLVCYADSSPWTKISGTNYAHASRITPTGVAMKSQTDYLTFQLPARMGFINITPTIEQFVKRSGIREGLLLCNAMHITASIFINDDEPGLHEDYQKWLEELAPFDASPTRYHHNRTGEDNADAHMKRQIMGREVVVAITNGKLDFGPWEQIFYGEFDGRRPKRVLVKIIGE